MEKDVKQFLEARQASITTLPSYSTPRARYPVFRRVIASAHAANTLIAPGEKLTPFKRARLEAMFHAGMAKEPCANEAALKFEETMQRLKAVIDSNPQIGETVTDIVYELVKNYGLVIRDFVNHQGGREEATMRPLEKRNAATAAAVERARSIATELWISDTNQAIRLGEMGEKVYRALAGEGFAESLPGTAERVKEWIKPVAPDYARKGGRRRKTP